MGEGKRKPMLGWLCKIKYIAYFYDKTIFDTSPQNGQGTVELFIGDITWPEGLWKGMQDMRRGERAKIRIQKKHGFGRIGEVDKLRFPKGYSLEEKDAERRAKLVSKAVIYEVTMVDWVERMDMEANGLMYKEIFKKAGRREYELPNEEFDEVVCNIRAWQSPTDSLIDAPQCDFPETVPATEAGEEEQKTAVAYEKQSLVVQDGQFLAMDKVKCKALKKALRSMKRGEQSRFTVMPDFLNEEEDEGMEEFLSASTQSWDKARPFVLDLQLVNLTKVEDWYSDKTTIMRTLRKGKGRNAYSDSTIYFRIKIEVNGNQIYSNYPESALPVEQQEDFK